MNHIYKLLLTADSAKGTDLDPIAVLALIVSILSFLYSHYRRKQRYRVAFCLPKRATSYSTSFSDNKKFLVKDSVDFSIAINVFNLSDNPLTVLKTNFAFDVDGVYCYPPAEYNRINEDSTVYLTNATYAATNANGKNITCEEIFSLSKSNSDYMRVIPPNSAIEIINVYRFITVDGLKPNLELISSNKFELSIDIIDDCFTRRAITSMNYFRQKHYKFSIGMLFRSPRVNPAVRTIKKRIQLDK